MAAKRLIISLQGLGLIEDVQHEGHLILEILPVDHAYLLKAWWVEGWWVQGKAEIEVLLAGGLFVPVRANEDRNGDLKVGVDYGAPVRAKNRLNAKALVELRSCRKRRLESPRALNAVVFSTRLDTTIHFTERIVPTGGSTWPC